MSMFVTDRELEQIAAGTERSAARKMICVVGYDGSPAAGHALDAAARLLGDREGELLVVYVAHVPATAGLVAGAYAQIEEIFNEEAKVLEDELQTRLDGLRQPWHFQRRNGIAAGELTAAARELAADHPNADIGIIVGASSNWYHRRIVGSVGTTVTRGDCRFSLVVVP